MKNGTTAVNTMVFLLSLAFLFTSTVLVETSIKQLAHAQNATSNNQTTTSSNASTTGGASDINALRDEYFAKWKQLDFKSGFDTFVEPGSVQGYGVYHEHPSNIFRPDTSSIALYVEPVGYGYKEGVDEKGNVLYSVDFNTTMSISDKQGKPITEPIPADFGNALNSHRQATEVFMPITLDLEQPLPIGEYTITYTITDNTSGKSTNIVKDIRVAETVS
jgi:hypothetical protein